MTDRPHFVPLCRRQSVDGPRAFDFSQRPGRSRADILVTVFQRSDQRLDRPIVLDFAEGPGGQDANFRVAVFQRDRECAHRAAVLDFAQGPDGRLPHIRDRIVHQCLERSDS